jgi:hypothetical protein
VRFGWTLVRGQVGGYPRNCQQRDAEPVPTAASGRANGRKCGWRWKTWLPQPDSYESTRAPDRSAEDGGKRRSADLRLQPIMPADPIDDDSVGVRPYASVQYGYARSTTTLPTRRNATRYASAMVALDMTLRSRPR